MSFSTEVSMPSYIIYRDIPAGQPFDVMAPLAFFPPKDSDELFDALRTKYPHLRTHSERTRQAVIEYLMQEDPLSASMDQLPTPQTAPSVNCSPWEASMQSMSSESSTWSSPELFDLATPLFGNSPQPQSQALTRQPSTTAAMSTAEGTPPALEQMTGVFSLSDHSQPKQRVRRKMTEAEKAEYRKRRIVKACDKCAKRKRKCNHNQPEMENLASQTHKVAKSTPVSNAKSTTQQQQKSQQQQKALFSSDLSFFDQSFTSDVPMPSFEDFTMLPDHLLYTGDDAQVPFDYWPHHSLFDPATDGSQHSHTRQPNSSHNLLTEPFNSHTGALWSNQPIGDLELPQVPQQPTHTHHLHESYGLGGLDLLDLNNTSGTDPRAQWQQQPLTQAQGSQRQSLYSVEQQMSRENASANGGSGRYPSLADLTHRLTGTKKAIAAFGKLLPQSSVKRSNLQKVSLRKIAIVALGGLSIAQAGGLGTGMLPPQLNQIVAGHGDCSRAPCANCGGRFSMKRDLQRHVLSHVHVAPDRWDDLLGDQLNTGAADLESGSSGTSSRVNRQATLQDNSRSSSGDDGDIPIPIPRPSPKYHQVKTHARSLGEGISTMKSPNTELYMLRRGISNGGLSTLRRGNMDSLQQPLMVRPTANPETSLLQVNGGAYQRLESSARHDVLATAGASTSVANATVDESSANIAAPVHTQSNTANSSGFPPTSTALSRFPYSGPDASGRWSANGQGTEVDHNAIAAPSAQAASESNAPLINAEGISTLLSRCGWSGSNASGHWHMNGQGTEEAHVAVGTDSTVVDFAYRSPTHNEVVTYRLSDHFRRRDHFGRMVLPSGMGLLVALVGLATLLVMIASLVSVDTSSMATSSLTFVLLALLQPVSDTDPVDASGGTSFDDDHTDVDERLFGSLQKRVGRFLGRAFKIGGRGRINSIGKKAI